MSSLRQMFKGLLTQDRLSDREYRKFQRLLEDKPQRPWFQNPRMLGVGAVSVAFVLFLALAVLPLNHDKRDIYQRIAEEVLVNHTRLYLPDVLGDSVADLRPNFERLDFSPLNSSLINRDQWSLKGGRYCTLQGAIAVQMSFESPAGHTLTHYQAAYDPAKFGSLPDTGRNQPPLTLVRQGVRIDIWVENDLVMASAYHTDGTAGKDGLQAETEFERVGLCSGGDQNKCAQPWLGG
mgnify:CR=1 FL=1